MSLTFIKKEEDFICEHCAFAVKGNGYTNHCPQCLWSMHVDNFPGDRASTCGGMMPPTALVMEKGEFVLTNTCEKCGHTKRNKTTQGDNLDAFLNKKADIKK